jgi:hypothetical protein
MKVRCDGYDKKICGQCGIGSHEYNQECDHGRYCITRKIIVKCVPVYDFKDEIGRILEI